MGDILKRFKEIEQASNPQTMAKLAYDTWVKFTPKDTGNARNKTKLKNTEIHADYPYAVRLDQGWSKQFQGQGMTKPTLAELQKYVKNNLKKRGA
jgi:hypothetical protein